jgi:hypothetical protein
MVYDWTVYVPIILLVAILGYFVTMRATSNQGVDIMPHNFFERNQTASISNEEVVINSANYVWDDTKTSLVPPKQ